MLCDCGRVEVSADLLKSCDSKFSTDTEDGTSGCEMWPDKGNVLSWGDGVVEEDVTNGCEM